MEEEIKDNILNDSLNNKINNNSNINVQDKEEGNNENVQEQNFISDYNDIYVGKNKTDSNQELKDNYENINKNYTIMLHTDNALKKITNQKVNKTLNDIYGAIANINEVNKKVKNIILNRPHKSMDTKRKMMKGNVNKINNFRSKTGGKNNYNKQYYIKNNNDEDIDYNYPSNYTNHTNDIAPKSVKFYSYNLNDDNNIYRNRDNIYSGQRKYLNSSSITSSQNNIKNIPNNINNYYYNSSNNNKNLHRYNKPIKKNNIKVILNQRNNEEYYNRKFFYPKINDKYSDNELLMYNDCSNDSNEKYSDYSNIDSFYNYNYDCNNERDIQNMENKLNKEEKKLRELEEEKNKLLKEQKISKKIILEKIKEKNKIKKQSLIKQYKRKINLIRKLQAQSINEIIQLEKKKKNDESKIYHINNLINDKDINKNLIKLKKDNRKILKDNIINEKRQNSINDNTGHLETENVNENEEFHPMNNDLNKIITFSKDFNQNQNPEKLQNLTNNDENNLNRDQKYIEYLYEITSSYNNSNNSKSFNTTTNVQSNASKKKSTQKLNNNNNNNKKLNLYNYFYNINNDNIGQNNYINNNIKNINNKDLDLDNLLIQQSNEKKKPSSNYNSYSRKYNKKKINNNKLNKKGFSPNIEIPSYIKERVNKYNHSINRKANNTYRSSFGQITPYSINYNNLHSNYNLPSNITNRSNSFYYSNKKNRGNCKTTHRKKTDLNYKYLFFNNE